MKSQGPILKNFPQSLPASSPLQYHSESSCQDDQIPQKAADVAVGDIVLKDQAVQSEQHAVIIVHQGFAQEGGGGAFPLSEKAPLLFSLFHHRFEKSQSSRKPR